MIGINRTSQRFNLLLLDEGEYYFEDFSAYYYPPGFDDDQSVKRRIKGRLKLCSYSLIFDPDEWKYPIMRFCYRHMDGLHQWEGPLLDLLPDKTDVFEVKSNVYIEMKENNVNAPYIFKEEKKEHKLSLNYIPLSSFLPRANELFLISLQSPDTIDESIRMVIDARENSTHFDTTALEDINEQILLEELAIQVLPLVNNPGRILVTDSTIYFQPFNNVSSKPVEKFYFKNISRLAKRRYVLRHVGIELFSHDESSVFFTFKSTQQRDGLYDLLMQQPTVLQSLKADDQLNVSLRWQNGLISNYDYLMYLNFMAGRTFSDLTQYPVFPWVVSDYTSNRLDLNNPGNFRDLSKPIGALNPERLNMFKKRMKQMPDDSPKFLYGTHYSTPGYVLFYLVRQAPEYMLRLQNGKFDSPGRMFHSVGETWQGVTNNPADVKELIPEFYMTHSKGSFMTNSERLNLGVKENGEVLDDVVLPPWAKDAEDFVKKMREALECDYVSEHLHNWIDLIFGYKQKGVEAYYADNVFYHLTYEGAVDIDNIKDPHERAAIIAQIKEFGQTPKQLFPKPHPSRLPKEARMKKIPSIPSMAEPLETILEPLTVATWGTAMDELSEPYFSFKLHKDIITCFALSVDGNTLYSVSQDSTLKIYSLSEKKQLRSVNIGELSLSSCQLSTDERSVIIGSWDNNIYVYSIEYGRITDTIAAHDDAVSCICLRGDLLVSGSWDASVKLWQFSNDTLSQMPVADFIDNETEVHCVDIDQQCTLAVSGAADGSVTFFDLRERSSIRCIPEVHDATITQIQFTPDSKRVVSCSHDEFAKVIEVSGTVLLSVCFNTSLRSLRTDGDTLLVGGEDGILHVWDIRTDKEIKQLKPQNDTISAITASTSGDRLVTGCGGTIRMYRTVTSTTRLSHSGSIVLENDEEEQDEY